MPQNTNVSIIQLITSGEISVQYEISKIKASEGINIQIRNYLEKSNHYQIIQQHIINTKEDLQNAESITDKLHLSGKLQNLYKVKKDFVCNTLYLAETLSKIEPRTNKLRKAYQFFEEAKIREADAILNEVDLLNDQFGLLALVRYQKIKINSIENDSDLKFD